MAPRILRWPSAGAPCARPTREERPPSTRPAACLNAGARRASSRRTAPVRSACDRQECPHRAISPSGRREGGRRPRVVKSGKRATVQALLSTPGPTAPTPAPTARSGRFGRQLRWRPRDGRCRQIAGKSYCAGTSLDGAAMESNHPSGGLLRPAGFEDRMGHQTPAAPCPILGCRGSWTSGPRRGKALRRAS